MAFFVESVEIVEEGIEKLSCQMYLVNENLVTRFVTFWTILLWKGYG